MNEVYVTSGAFPQRQLADILPIAESWGVKSLELSGDVAPDLNNLAIARAARRQFNILLHNYFPPALEPFVINLASTDAEILMRSRSHCLAALELSAELNAPFFAAHSGFTFTPRPDQLGQVFSEEVTAGREQAYKIFVDSVGDLVFRGKSIGVSFLVENNVVIPSNARGGKNRLLLLADPGEICRCAVDVGSGFGLLMDMAHLKVSGRTLNFDPVDAVMQTAAYIQACHLSENDGTRDDNRSFDETAWFLPHLRDHWIVTIEAYRIAQSELCKMMFVLDNRKIYQNI